jgi:predicted RNA-binding Zn-ribbon protein involved in translation (DUF1610 family)
MSWKQSIPLGIGVVLAVVAAGVIGAAMFVTDKGEELIHMYGDYRAAQRKAAAAARADHAMELRGRWNGMSLTAANSPTARALGVREVENGVVVAEMSPLDGQAAQLSGVRVGDVLVGVDGQQVRDLADLYNISRTKNPTDPTLVDVKRHNNTMTLMLPAAQQANQLPAFGGENERPNAWGAGVPAAFTGQQFYCPQHGAVVPMGGVVAMGGGMGRGMGNPYRCPHCQALLQQFNPALR